MRLGRRAWGGESGREEPADAAPSRRRSPLLQLLAVGLYGGIVLALTAADLLHFRRRRAAGRCTVTCPEQGPPPEVVAVASA